jgi:hypothetical protein
MTTASFKVSEFLSEINDGELLNHKVDLKKKKDKFIAELATKHLIDRNTRTTTLSITIIIYLLLR